MDPLEFFSVGRFVEAAEQAIRGVHGRQCPIFAVGGTVLYLKALTEGLFEGPAADPVLRQALLQKAEGQGADALHRESAGVDPETAAASP